MQRLRRVCGVLALAAATGLLMVARAAAIEHATTPENDETRNSLIAQGTLLRVALLQTITTAHCPAPPATFQFKVLDNVMAGSRVAIPAGTVGTGRVTLCSPAHGGRKDGRLHLEFDPIVLPDGTQVSVGITHESLVADANQKNGAGPALEDIANMTIPGFFILDYLRKGDDVTIQANTPFHLAVTEDAFLAD